MNKINYEERLGQLKKDLDKAKNLKYQAEARLEQLEKQEMEIIEDLKSLNIKPEDLAQEIKKLDGEIEDLFRQAQAKLPKDLLG